jgi:hypothetical protein
MIFSPKVQTVGSIKGFLVKNQTEEISTISKNAFLSGFAIGIINQLPPLHLAVPTMAMPTPMLGTISITEKIISAFNPIIQLIQGLSYPVGFIMLTAGFLVMMTGNRQKGLNMIKWAAIGYVGMQFAPAVMTILVEVGRELGK